MALLTVDDVITATTADEIEAEILSLCATGGLPTTAWESGDVVRTLITAISQEIAAKSLMEIEIAKGGLGDLASPAWAKLWAQTIYNVLFVPAAPATGSVTFTNASPTNYTRNAGDITVAHKTTGKTYRNQASVSIPASGVLADVPIQADEIGTASNAAPAEISKVVTSLVGVTVTNSEAVLGADEESTTALVARTRSKLGSLSPNGPKDAYDYVARTPQLSATSTPITRTKTTADPATGEVIVYLATAGGAPTSPDVAIVQAAIIIWAEPWCVMSTAAAATNVTISVTYELWIKTSLTLPQVQSAVQVALATYMATVPVGGITGAGATPPNGAVYVEALTNIIHTSMTGVQLVKVTVPGGDVTITPDQVPVLGTVNGTVHLL